MCGSFFVDGKNREIDRLLAMLPADAPPVRTGQLYPSENALIILPDEKVASMAWGFPAFDGKKLIFNARAETALDKPMFARALRTHPAAVPASGFYEWHAPEKGARKDKYLFTNPASPILYLAAFWNTFKTDAGANPRHFTILTTAANDSMLPYHHRMPILLRKEAVQPWLAGENLREVLAESPYSLQARPA